MYAVGIAGHLIDTTLQLMKTLTPFTLLLTGGVVLFYSIKNSEQISNKIPNEFNSTLNRITPEKINSQLVSWVILTYLITFFLEVIGTKTGIVFGSYQYGNTLGLKLFDVPLIIGFNWVLVVIGAILLAKKFFNDEIFIALATGLFAVIFDFFLEPIAIKLDYWNWQNNQIPLQNYAAWFVIAFLFSILFQKMKIEIKSDLAKKYFLTQLIFFLSLFLFMR